MKRFKAPIALLLAVVVAVACFTGISPVESNAAEYVTYDSASDSYKSGKYYEALTSVELTGDPRVDIVNIAKSQIGYQEGASEGSYSGEVAGSNNYVEYGYWYGWTGVAWCAQFVSWCAAMAGVGTDVILKHQYTETGKEFFVNRNEAYTWDQVKQGLFMPMAGDIVYFYGGTAGRTVTHVGIVEKFEDGVLYTIEGNASSAYFTSEGGCCTDRQYTLDSEYVKYICRPSYVRTDAEQEETVVPEVDVIDGYYAETGTYVVTTSSINVRDAAVTGNAVGYFSNGEVFECLEVIVISDDTTGTEKRWARIVYSGETAYISLNTAYIEPYVQSESTGEPVEPYDVYGISSNKDTYYVGEDIIVSAFGTTSTDWMGIYKKGETYDPTNGGAPSIYWGYLSDMTDLKLVINDTSKVHNNLNGDSARSDAADYADGLPAGDYTVCLFKDDGYEVAASVDITVENFYESDVKDPVWKWDFAEQGYIADGVSSQSSNGDYVSMTDNSGDGMLYPSSNGSVHFYGMPVVDLDAGKYIVVKMRVTSGETNANQIEVLAMPDGTSASLVSAIGTVDESTEWQYVIIDCSNISGWAGSTTPWFRLDPVNCSGTSCDVDWFALFATADEATIYILADKYGAEPDPEYETGDVDGNGSINMLDVIALRRYLLNSETYPVANETAADANANGSINMLDVIALRRYLINSTQYPLG